MYLDVNHVPIIMDVNHDRTWQNIFIVCAWMLRRILWLLAECSCCLSSVIMGLSCSWMKRALKKPTVLRMRPGIGHNLDG